MFRPVVRPLACCGNVTFWFPSDGTLKLAGSGNWKFGGDPVMKRPDQGGEADK